ncbi:MAG: ribonuclease HI family protein, partial [Candidatus Omnitrophica bacterium]|nr:ribonuclease HI family protein [Candidatus Omnitrophota bacterium]
TYTDGGARGNPGPAAIGILICSEDGEILLEHAEAIGEATNNVAEYSALIKAMKLAKELKADDLNCFLDSLLVVKQLQGEYKIKHINMQKLFDQVQKVKREFKRVSYTHVPREEENIQRADQLVNFALDEAKKRAR